MRLRRGVTLIELVIVCAILSVLLGLLIPAVQSSREKARETVCKNNLYQLNLALGQLAEVQKALPLPAPPGQAGGWTVEILPFLEQGNLRNTVPAGLSLGNVPPPLHAPPILFRCPRRSTLEPPPAAGVWPAHYVLIQAGRRESFLLFDAPISLHTPWLSGPEFDYETMRVEMGPHHDGFFFVRGFQQGVSFMLHGETVN